MLSDNNKDFILHPMPESYIHCNNPTLIKIEEMAVKIREDVIDMLVEAGSGHSAGALGAADILATLYFHIMNIDPQNSNDENRDKLVLSNGHICPALYATLAEKGFIEKKELWTLRKLGTKLQGHPVLGLVPGIENSSGSLGQGLAIASGMALAYKMDSKTNRVYCLSGDGELAEGSIWEAAMFASSKRLNNLTWIIDRNNIQTDGFTEDVMPLENLRDKLEAFNWYVIEVDGHNVEEIINACNMARSISQRPTVIIAHTIPGYGVKFMEYKFEWHAKAPNKEQAKEALKNLRSLEGKIKCEYD